MINKEPLYIFLLIPKTGTTSIVNMARNNYDPSEILVSKIFREKCDGKAFNFSSDCSEVSVIVEKVRSQENTLKAVFLMAPFGIHEHLNRRCRYITFLRDPVSRCLSMIRFLYENPENATAQALKDHKEGLVGIVEGHETLTFSNEMVRMLSGTENITCTKDDLRIADENLRNMFDCIGTQETFENSVAKISKLLNWKNHKVTPRLNATSTNTSSLAGLNELLLFAKENHYDSALYNRWVSQRTSCPSLTAIGEMNLPRSFTSERLSPIF